MAGDWIEKTLYPQAPSMTDEEIVSFFEQVIFARLGTVNEDGTVHIAPVYFKYEGGQIVIATQEPSRKIRNIKRNNNVTVLIDTTEIPYRGVLVYGTAELDYEDIIAKRIAIFERRPWAPSREEGEAYARKLSNKWQCAIVRITPLRMASFDYSKG
jgi:nitroimidazol reductase NimA-like FMN-containing flavoprotein (pyridoxamine 5'-phosphate oxidase superfamily)